MPSLLVVHAEDVALAPWVRGESGHDIATATGARGGDEANVGATDGVTRLREQVERRRASGAVGAVDEVVVGGVFSKGVVGGADAGGQE